MRRVYMVALLCVVTILVTTLLSLALFPNRSDQMQPNTFYGIDAMATIRPDTEFRVFRRRSENYSWDDGSSYPRSDALVVLDALDRVKLWEPDSTKKHVGPPPIAIELEWCEEMKDKAHQEMNSLAICIGNTLFWYRNNLYEVPEKSYEILNRMFPENK